MSRKNKNKQASVENLDTTESAPVQEIEVSLEEAQIEQEPVEQLVDFDGWYALRRHQIPAQHHKEIIKADFKGRKVPVMGTITQFDEALAKYGIKVK